jgi:protein SCO1/2
MLCPYVLRDLAGSLKAVSFDIGKEYEVITISFDPRDTPAAATHSKSEYLKMYGRAGAGKGWHFLTGDQKSIDAITKAVGFSYQWDEQQKQFAHASGLMISTPQGKLARYFYGIEYPPKDIRLALVEASENKIGTPVDQVLLFCFHYDPSTGKYSAYAVNLVRLGGIITVFALSIFIYKEIKREKPDREKDV